MEIELILPAKSKFVTTPLKKCGKPPSVVVRKQNARTG